MGSIRPLLVIEGGILGESNLAFVDSNESKPYLSQFKSQQELYPVCIKIIDGKVNATRVDSPELRVQIPSVPTRGHVRNINEATFSSETNYLQNVEKKSRPQSELHNKRRVG